jgi:hypothetical protein
VGKYREIFAKRYPRRLVDNDLFLKTFSGIVSGATVRFPYFSALIIKISVFALMLIQKTALKLFQVFPIRCDFLSVSSLFPCFLPALVLDIFVFRSLFSIKLYDLFVCLCFPKCDREAAVEFFDCEFLKEFGFHPILTDASLFRFSDAFFAKDSLSIFFIKWRL